MTDCVTCGDDTGSDFPEIDQCFWCFFGFGLPENNDAAKEVKGKDNE